MSARIADRVRDAGVPVIVTNETFRLARWADMLMGNDAAWWLARHEEALLFAGVKICTQDCCPFPEVMTLRETCRSEKTGFDPDPACVRTGGNSGYAALHVAAQAGAARILLCGLDMRGEHWHRPHSGRLLNTLQPTFAIWMRRFESLAVELDRRGTAVLNCTPGSALKCFPSAALEDALAGEVV